jgi:hypothetical protein
MYCGEMVVNSVNTTATVISCRIDKSGQKLFVTYKIRQKQWKGILRVELVVPVFILAVCNRFKLVGLLNALVTACNEYDAAC